MSSAPDPWRPCWLLDPKKPKWCAEQANGRGHCPAGYCFVADRQGEQLSLLEDDPGPVV